MRFLADTQVLVWYVTDPDRLTARSVAAMQASIDDEETVGVSAFSLVELASAAEKKSNAIGNGQFTSILAVLHDPESPFEVLSVDFAIGERVRQVPRTVNADPGDRIIVATAEVHGLAVISSDSLAAEMTDQEIIW